MQLFEDRKRNSIVSYSRFRKLHLCAWIFLYLFFACKIKAIEQALLLIRNTVPERRNFINTDITSPRPLHTRSRQKITKIIRAVSALLYITNTRSFTGCFHIVGTGTFIFIFGASRQCWGCPLQLVQEVAS